MAQLAALIILGILAQWLAWRIKVPSILPLILIGLFVGPISTYFTPDGTKWIEPIYNTSTGHGLFPGHYLFYFVSLAIGVILFEGGLTLKRRELKNVGGAIVKLITFGSLVTFIGAGLATHYLMGLNLSISFLFAGLIIVTGPTVIAPILQNLPLNRNVSTVLKWEGIIIDPIGAFVAVLMFEFIVSGEGGAHYSMVAVKTFMQSVLIGIALGGVTAYALYQMIKNELIPHYLLNVFILATVILAFVISDYLSHESGLLTVVVMGIVMGNLDVPHLKEISSFKESLSVLLISILFILLASNITMDEIRLIMDIRCLGLFLVVVFILRPLGVFLSTRKSELSTREKLFISWVGPRGIVAAGVASLFGIRLTQLGYEGAQYITPLVFMIVLGTVLLNATTARLVAKALGVIQKASDGVLFIGANKAARLVAQYLKSNGRHVVLLDSNQTNVNLSGDGGLEAFEANIYNDELSDHYELVDMGYVLAMTSSPEVNKFAIKKCKKLFGENGSYRLLSPDEMQLNKSELPKVGIFSYYDDFLNINEVVRDYPEVHEMEINSTEELSKWIRKMSYDKKMIPIFIKIHNVNLYIIKLPLNKIIVEQGYKLVYIGKKIDE